MAVQPENHMSTHEAIVQINHSALQPQTKLNAFQLLEQVDPNSGHITLTREELCALFEVGSDGAARRHLGRMQAAGIIHYSTNAAVYINFRAWIDPRLRVGARLADHPRAASRAWARGYPPRSPPSE
jgi:hypothetical protein